MFGKNVLLKQVRDLAETDNRFWVQEVFPTIQGEGPFTGEPAVFVRMGGCNLKCFFCDTDFESSEWHPSGGELLDAIDTAMGQSKKIVVFTGGEPLRQPIGPIVHELRRRGKTVQIETAGSIWDESWATQDVAETCWVCSPKTPKLNANIIGCCYNYKYIVRVGDASPEDGLPIYSTQSPGALAPLYRPPQSKAGVRIWVQPCEEYIPGSLVKDRLRTKANTNHAIDLCMTYGYRLSIQTHKVLGLP